MAQKIEDWRCWFRLSRLILAFCAALLPATAFASLLRVATTPVSICDRAALWAADRHDVPPDVLLAITRTETGRHSVSGQMPWPWTVNMEGRGRWFESQAEALAYVRHHHGSGARSFDVGCFQINYRWHGDAFASFEEMFDPRRNADYAAVFLKSLYAELGDWTKAAGAFHSRTEVHSARYREKFEQIRADVDPAPDQGTMFSAAQPLIARQGRALMQSGASLLDGNAGSRPAFLTID